MFIEERHKCILECLETQGKVFVKDLSNKFNLSESMIRKDLQALEKQNLLKRTYGGAIKVTRHIVKEISYSKRIQNNIELKEIVAKKAYEMINDNDVVFLDASSISYCIAKLIASGDKKITIITNMIVISSILESNEDIIIIYIGGDYNRVVGGSIGSHAVSQIQEYHCNKAFVGCVGVNLDDGLLSTTLSEDASCKKAIMKIAKESYLLVLNERFNLDGTFNYGKITDFASIITESTPDSSILAKLEKYDVNLI